MQASLRRGMATAARARPLSPHLEIYTFKPNMITSVLFRGTGIVMTGGLGALAIGSLFAAHPYKHYVAQLQSYPLINGVVKFGVAFPLAYHFAGGLRHLSWDHLIGHNTKAIATSGRVAVGVATAVGLAAAVTTFD